MFITNAEFLPQHRQQGRRRFQVTCRRAVAVLRRVDDAGLLVTVNAIARVAWVSRSWLYSQPDEIERLYDRRCPLVSEVGGGEPVQVAADPEDVLYPGARGRWRGAPSR